MPYQLLIVQIRRKIKKLIGRCSFLKNLLVLIYKVKGRKPWSLGYSIYKLSFILKTIKEHPEFFAQKELPLNYGFALDERAVEYPWFFSQIKDDEKILLDAGATLNHLEILTLPNLKDRQLFVATLYPEGEYMEGVSPTYVYEDLRRTSFCDQKFDAIACLSTLEHVGMNNTLIYTPDKSKEEDNTKAYLTAICELKRVLKEGGTLYLTVPYGKHKNFKWFQIFDTAMIEKVKKAFAPSKISETYFKYENDQWDFSSAQFCEDGYYFDIHAEKKVLKSRLAAAQSVVCLAMIK
ncbi:MAG: class I SAM-dependent methyltransferase [Candidatus Omnitrophica bacterium]|nr:class I SAM-dependent methyltransferase [Candidatus Omnitrophota bacterium]